MLANEAQIIKWTVVVSATREDTNKYQFVFKHECNEEFVMLFHRYHVHFFYSFNYLHVKTQPIYKHEFMKLAMQKSDNKRKIIILKNKFEIIKTFYGDYSNAKTGNDIGFDSSTARAILNKKFDYLEQGKLLLTSQRVHNTRNRRSIMI